ncbi:hypothetical protein L1987_02307 [Smallanthus sonchifolius]|uniref:Uncharacterized protein n=1 Tax=Smallanthus sonchifolius TaxID=185202 RepID=A0ACB9K7E0_9ASTR|nr:hypothetical protein L1987_02307 [Smallanthus sonchifolius]
MRVMGATPRGNSRIHANISAIGIIWSGKGNYGDGFIISTIPASLFDSNVLIVVSHSTPAQGALLFPLSTDTTDSDLHLCALLGISFSATWGWFNPITNDVE